MRSDTPVVVAIKTAKSGRGPAPGVGDRVLAKTFRNEDRSGPAYTGRVMKVFDKRANTALGVFRAIVGGAFRVVPVERGKPEFEVARRIPQRRPRRRSRRGRDRPFHTLRPAAGAKSSPCWAR